MQAIKCVTHHGCFHADDVLAAAILRRLFPGCEIIRTRDESKVANADVVFDVGGVYDVSRRRYDHHQKKGRAAPRPNGIEYSSAGLVWRHEAPNLPGMTERTLAAVDKALFQVVDATDNGQYLFDGGKPVFEGVGNYSLSSVLAGFNPNWRMADGQFDSCFEQAVEFASGLLDREIYRAEGAPVAERLTVEAVSRSREADPRLVILERYHDHENIPEESGEALYVVFPDEDGYWRVQCVPPTSHRKFEQRKPLPAAWRGLRNGELAAVTGVEGSVFCHNDRWIAVAKSREGVMKLAALALAS